MRYLFPWSAAFLLLASTGCMTLPPVTSIRGVIMPGPGGQQSTTIELQYSNLETRSGANGEFEISGVHHQSDKLIFRQGDRTFALIIKVPLGVTVDLGELDLWSQELGFLVIYLSGQANAQAYLARSAYATSLQEMNIMNVGVNIEGGRSVIRISGLSGRYPQIGGTGTVDAAKSAEPPGSIMPGDLSGWISSVMSNLHVNTISGSTGLTPSQLQNLATNAGLNAFAWDRFVAEGKMPAIGEDGFTPENFLKMAIALSDAIQPEVIAALALSLTGMEPEELLAWSRKNATKILRNDDGSFTQLAAAGVLALLHHTRELKEKGVKEVADLAELASDQPRAAGVYPLYDASQGNLPEDQGWLYLHDPLATAARTVWRDGATVLDTTAERTDKAGFFTEDPLTGPLMRHPRMPVLDRRAGYRVTFSVQIDGEEHVRDDRAGFSVLVIGNDLAGIELGFWRDEVWAQADDGTPIFQDSRAETVRHHAGSGVGTFTLAVESDRYELSSGDRVILSGSLRNYARFGGFPYDTPNFIFLGDNTTSAGGTVRLGDIRVELVNNTDANASYFKPSVLRALGLSYLPVEVDNFLNTLTPDQMAALLKFSNLGAGASLESMSPEELTALAAIATRVPGGALLAGQPMGGVSLLFRAFGYQGPPRESAMRDINRKNLISAEQMARLAEKARRLKAATELLESNQR